MKNNKGFTLIEVLGIIAILGIIALVAAPNMTKQIENEEKQQKNVIEQKIINASKLYASKYYASQIALNKTFDFTLADLENDGLLILKDGQCLKSSTDTVRSGNDYKITYSSSFDYSNIEDLENCY